MLGVMGSQVAMTGGRFVRRVAQLVRWVAKLVRRVTGCSKSW
jgi:hypothetical protein